MTDYYRNGSNEVAQVTAVTFKKLEQRRILTKSQDRLVICLVGLPGRGKSFIARKLQSFLLWRGNACEIFNVGKYRRQVQAEHEKTKAASSPSIRQSVGACDANFFDSSNPEAKALRQQAASAGMKAMLEWLDVEEELDMTDKKNLQYAAKARINRTRIAIFDATNSTVARRKWVLEECTSAAKRGNNATGCIFVESLCDDAELLEENFRFKVQNSPDFKGMTEEEAITDLRERVQKYEDQYETIDDDTQSYIKIFNLSSKMLVNHIYGRMAKVIVPSLMSWNIGSRPIILCRAGHTKEHDNFANGDVERKVIRGDKLGVKGLQFREKLMEHIKEEADLFSRQNAKAHRKAFAPTRRHTGTSISGLAPFEVLYPQPLPFQCHIMTSTMPRAVETAYWETLPFKINEFPNLNPLDKGDFSGMELDDMKEVDPEWYALLKEDPFLTRFPGGECYGDLIHRLETCIIDMEQQINMVCVVSHVSVLQVLMAYFRRTPIEKCSSIEVPMNTVFKFTPVTGGGWTESQTNVCPEFGEEIMMSDSDDDRNSERTIPIWGDRRRSSDSASSNGTSCLI